MNAAVLFARKDSIYKSFPDLDVWDIERNARLWPGGCPVIAHPPCGPWANLRKFCHYRFGERELALWAVDLVRSWGGVLEHPATSLLWPDADLPEPGSLDEFGGFTIWISQWWFGHKADKSTRLYICGVRPDQLPPIPFKMGAPTHVIGRSRLNRNVQHCTKSEREHTPRMLAEWLRQVALLAGDNAEKARAA